MASHDDSPALLEATMGTFGKRHRSNLKRTRSVETVLFVETHSGKQQERKRGRSTNDGDSNNDNVLLFQRLDPRAQLPCRGSPGAAGYDLYAIEACTLPAGGVTIVPLGLAVAIPPGWYGRVAPRSSLGAKQIDVGAGVIDSDYRGAVGVVLYNHGASDHVIDAGERVAQLLIERVARLEPAWTDELTVTERGTGGFGSTGRTTIVPANPL